MLPRATGARWVGRFYVYLLLDPTCYYLPFYVGKGSGKRYRKHFHETLETTSNPRKFHRIQKIINQGYKPKVMIWQNGMSESEAYSLEERLIRRFGRKRYDPEGILENLVIEARPPGFNNCQDKEAFRAKCRARLGPKNGFFGKHHSDETKLRIGERHTGKEISKEQRLQISEKLAGKSKSEEHRRAIGNAQRGKPKDPTSVAKMVATRRLRGSYGKS